MRAGWKLRLILIGLTAGWFAGCQSPGSQRAPVSVPSLSPARQNSHPLPSQPRHDEETHRDAASQTDRETDSNVSGDVACGSIANCGPCPLTPAEVFRHDRREFFPMLAEDARGLVNCRDLSVLAGALGGSIAIHQDWDDEVREYVREHPRRWGKGSEALGYFGEVQHQVPVLLGVYGYSLATSNGELHELSRALISAYTITGLSTLTVKVVSDTERPSRKWNDGRFGFPSFHTSSSFAVAAVVEEYEGLPTAIPIYTLAGLVGWSRIDERDHDLSDVVFGAALGYVIGKSVARQHRKHDSPFRFKPYQHPEETAGGLAMEWRY